MVEAFILKYYGSFHKKREAFEGIVRFVKGTYSFYEGQMVNG